MLMIDIALLILRVTVGLMMAGHGAQKAFGWFGGNGPRGFEVMVRKNRLRPAWLWTALAILAELVGGIIFALGLLSPLGALAIIAAMLMAMILVTWPRYWGTNRGIENNLVYIIPAVVEALAGPGKFSLDALLGISFPEPLAFLIGLVLVITGIAFALITRTPREAQDNQPANAPARDPVAVR